MEVGIDVRPMLSQDSKINISTYTFRNGKVLIMLFDVDIRVNV